MSDDKLKKEYQKGREDMLNKILCMTIGDQHKYLEEESRKRKEHPPIPNPQRCETCTTESCYFHPSKTEWREGMTDGMDMSPIKISTFTERFGCTLHSERGNLVWMTPEEEEKRIRKDEREAVLRELYLRFKEHVFPVGLGGRKLFGVIREQMDQMRAEHAPLDKRENT